MFQLPQVVACVASCILGWQLRTKHFRKQQDTKFRRESMLARLHRAIRPKQVSSRNGSRKSLLSTGVERSARSDFGPHLRGVMSEDSYEESNVFLPPTHHIFSVIQELQKLQKDLSDTHPAYSQKVTSILNTLGGEMEEINPELEGFFRDPMREFRVSGRDACGSIITNCSVTDVSTFELLRSFSTPVALGRSANSVTARDYEENHNEENKDGQYKPKTGPPITGRMIMKSCSERRDGALCLKEPSAALKRELQKIERWEEFDVFLVAEMCGGHALVTVAMTLFDKYDLLNKLDIKREKMVAFLDAVETAYFQDGNPYHNSTHASDVMQSMAVMLFSWELSKFLSDEEIFACLLAAVIHDVGHPGWTNEFQVNNSHERALLYNDLSVNENHHLALAFKIAQDPSCDIFGSMKRPAYKALRHLLVQMVMGTDMSNHFDIMQRFTNEVSNSTNVDEWDDSARLFFLKVILHCADISNPGKPVPSAVRWSEMLVNEFYLQGDEERRCNLPVTPICDRNIYMMPRSQLGFITFIVQPTFNKLAELAPLIAENMLPLLETTRQYWAKEVAILDSQEAVGKTEMARLESMPEHPEFVDSDNGTRPSISKRISMDMLAESLECEAAVLEHTAGSSI